MAHQLRASLPSLCSFSGGGGGGGGVSSRSRPRPSHVTMPTISSSSSSSVGAKSTSTYTTTTAARLAVVRADLKSAASANTNNVIVRRSADYKPAIWTFDHIQSLTNHYVGESYARRVNELKEQVRVMLVDDEADPLAQLHLIDMLQRLGLSYHFEDQIQSILNSMHRNNETWNWKHNNLHATALQFRLLRQHGYWVPQEVFSGFLDDKTGNFKASLCEDTESMLSLYEASYHLIEDESILEEAKDFTTKNLKKYLQRQNKDENLAIFISHALELPLHWRMKRLETRWFIDAYAKTKHMNPILLELAKLDYNILQSVHQQDLKQSYRWWRNTGLVEKLSFVRDRLVENCLWSVGIISEPQFGRCRRVISSNISLITAIDDIYDVYGTLDELELFTNAVERWDMNSMDQLPDYMKLCYLALLNSINEMAFDVLKQQDFHIIKYLKKTWADLCKAYLKEAKWYHSGYTPSLEEYMENAWLSISAPLILIHAYFFTNNPITQEALQCLEDYKGIIQTASTVFRFADDLGTSSDELKRGDVVKSVQCYMHESGASEDEAREHMKFLIYETWKKMNKQVYGDDDDDDDAAKSPFSKTFIKSAMDITRMSQCAYLYGDGYGVPDGDTKHMISSLIIEPIPLN